MPVNVKLCLDHSRIHVLLHNMPATEPSAYHYGPSIKKQSINQKDGVTCLQGFGCVCSTKCMPTMKPNKFKNRFSTSNKPMLATNGSLTCLQDLCDFCSHQVYAHHSVIDGIHNHLHQSFALMTRKGVFQWPAKKTKVCSDIGAA